MFRITDTRVEECPGEGQDIVRISWKCQGDGFAVVCHRSHLARGIHVFADNWMNDYGEDYAE